MGLFDTVLGAVMDQVQQRGGLSGVLGELLADDGAGGGLGALVQRFQDAGLGELVGSWIGRGDNLPVSAEQLQAVLGEGRLAELAQQAGLSPDVLGEQLAQALPGLVDRLTPDGQAPENGLGGLGDLLGSFGSLLQKS